MCFGIIHNKSYVVTFWLIKLTHQSARNLNEILNLRTLNRWKLQDGSFKVEVVLQTARSCCELMMMKLSRQWWYVTNDESVLFFYTHYVIVHAKVSYLARIR